MVNTSPKRFIPLSDEEKAKIITLRSQGNGYSAIARLLTQSNISRSESTVRSFYSSFEANRRFSSKRGRPTSPKKLDLNRVRSETEVDRTKPVRDHALMLECTPKALWLARKESGLGYFKTIPVPPLTIGHKNARVVFATQMLMNYNHLPIVFTDESSIQMDLSTRGIWRKRAEVLEESFYNKSAHQFRVMVFGGIGSDGHKTQLIRIFKSINKEEYVRYLVEDGIIADLDSHYGKGGYLFMEDNAPPHAAAKSITSQFVRHLQGWPARSPDLNPIEMVWARIKNIIRGQEFNNADELFAAVKAAWDSLTESDILELVTSFNARLEVVITHKGSSLNGLWKEVRHLHHKAFGPELPEDFYLNDTSDG